MRKSGAEITVSILQEQGIRHIFGYPGGQVLPIYEALRCTPEITHILTANEQGAAHAADGYARASGRIGAVLATSGPGATNLITGLAAAYADSVPMIALTGNVPRSLVGRDGFQEVDTWGLSIPVTKHSFLVRTVDELADTLRRAFVIAQSGRPGPVLIDIPKDVQTDTAEFTSMPPVTLREPPRCEDSQLAEAAKLIAASHRPYIYCGGGCVISHACHRIEALAELIDAPIGTSMMGLSSVPEKNPRKLGMQGMHGRYAASAALEEADLLLALGVRFSDRSHTVTGKRIIHIDIDAAEIDKNIPAYLGIIGDLSQSLDRLNPMLKKQKHPVWRRRLRELKAAEAEQTAEYSAPMHPASLIRQVSLSAPEAVFVTDVGQHQIWAAQACVLNRSRAFLTSGGLGAMGFGMGAALGAAAATGRRAVLFTGDGSFGMNAPELAAAVTQRLPVTVIVFNNGSLGMIRQWQDAVYAGSRFACDLPKTDFAKLAEAYGAKGWTVQTAEQFTAALQRALRLETPTLIDCRISPEWNVIPMLIHPDMPLE